MSLFVIGVIVGAVLGIGTMTIAILSKEDDIEEDD